MQHSMEHDMFQYAADRCRFTTSRVGLLSPFGYSRRWPLGQAGAADSLRWTSCAPRLHTKGFFRNIMPIFYGLKNQNRTLPMNWMLCERQAAKRNNSRWKKCLNHNKPLENGMYQKRGKTYVITTANICSDENDSKVDMKNDEG